MSESNHKASQYIVNLPVGMEHSDFDWSKAPELDSLIHRQLLCDMTARIERNVCMAKEQLSRRACHSHMHSENLPFNMNYLISGVRGSGKSVFMDLLVKCLLRELDPFAHGNGNLPRRYTAERYIDRAREDVRCRFLCHYDPTSSCNQPGFFFLYLLAYLQTTLEKVITEGRTWGGRQDAYVQECKAYLKKLNKGAVRLSQGKQAFGQLTEFQSYHMRADDPELDHNIRGNFAGAVDTLCKLCGVDAFIVSVDDADTRTEQCLRVLEELRLYIANPRLIVLVAGDMSLYVERVREQYFREYDPAFHHADEEGKSARMNSIISHAEQYMIKLFPLMHQYELGNILTLTGKPEPITIRLRGKTSKGMELPFAESEDLVSVVRKVFGAVISAGGADVEPYVKQFCCLPLRSIVHILNFWTAHSLWDSWNFIKHVITVRAQGKESMNKTENESDAYEQTKNENHSNPDWEYRHLVLTVKLSLMRALTDEIHYDDYKFSSVNVEEHRMLFALMLRHCQNMNDLEHGYFLSGDIGRSTADKFTTLLLAVASRSVTETLDGFLYYLLFGPATVSLFAKAVEQSCREVENSNSIPMRELREKFDRYLHVGSWSSPTRWARHANMIWCLDGNFEGLHSGVLRLRTSEMVRLVQDAMFPQTTGKIKNIFKVTYVWPEKYRRSFGERDDFRMDDNEIASLSIAMLVSMSKSSDRDNSYFISIFSFVAFIMKCIQRCDYERQLQKEGGADTCADAIKEIILDYSPIKVCRNPEWLIRKDNVKMFNTCNIETSQYIKDKDKQIEYWAQKIAEWYSAHINPMEQAPCADSSPLINDLTPRRMGQIWSDWYYGMKQVCYEVKSCSLDNNMEDKGAHVYRFLLTESDCLEKFSDVTDVFYNCFSPNGISKQKKKRYSHYAEVLRAFPLMNAFGAAAQILSEAWKEACPLPTNKPIDYETNTIWQTVPKNVRELDKKIRQSQSADE